MTERYTLALDASTYRGTIALLRGTILVAASEVAMRGATEERFFPAVVELLATHGVSVSDLEWIACGAGPGSFTSLRIAASTAKGIAAARRIPVVATPSTVLIIAGNRDELGAGDYLAVLDAMRGDWFVQRVRLGDDGSVAELSPVQLMNRTEALETTNDVGARLVGPVDGDGEGQVIKLSPHARGFALLLASPDGRLVEPIDLASWEPDYGRLAEAQVKWERAHGRPLQRGATS